MAYVKWLFIEWHQLFLSRIKPIFMVLLRPGTFKSMRTRLQNVRDTDHKISQRVINLINSRLARATATDVCVQVCVCVWVHASASFHARIAAFICPLQTIAYGWICFTNEQARALGHRCTTRILCVFYHVTQTVLMFRCEITCYACRISPRERKIQLCQTAIRQFERQSMRMF